MESAAPQPVPARLSVADLVKPLTAVAESIDDNFILSGKIPLAKPVVLSGSFGRIAFPTSLQGSQAQLRSLLAACRPAGFGHGQETVYNPAVRQALALPGSDFKLEDWDWGDTLEKIRLTLVPDAARVEAVLDKLNVYLVDGHFARHRDTPGEPNHFGTIVLCLPLCFGGGELAVSHAGTTERMGWSDMVKPKKSYDGFRLFNLTSSMGYQHTTPQAYLDTYTNGVPDDFVPYAAFFGHCEHQIEPVTFGARLTVAFKLLRVEHPSPTPTLANVDPALVVRATSVLNELRALIQKPEMAGRRLGFACAHLYEEKQLPKTTSAVKAAKDVIHLKGADLILAIAALHLKLTITVLRVVLDPDADATVAVAHLPDKTKPQSFSKKRKMGDSLFIGRAPSTWSVDFEDTDLTDKLGEGDEYSLDNAIWVLPLDKSKGRNALPPVYVSHTGYFGNEASQTTLYSAAALIVHMPAAGAPAAPASASAAASTELPATVLDALRFAANKPSAEASAAASASAQANELKEELLHRAGQAPKKALVTLCANKMIATSGNHEAVFKRIMDKIDMFTSEDFDDAGIAKVIPASEMRGNFYGTNPMENLPKTRAWSQSFFGMPA